MLQFKAPIGEIILYSYYNKEQEEIIKDPYIKNQTEDLIDLIIYRTNNKGIEYAASSLKDELFNLRTLYLDLLNKERDFFVDLDSKIVKNLKSNFFDLNKKEETGVIIQAYFKIVNQIFNNLNLERYDNYLNRNSLPSYNEFLSSLALIPGKEYEKFLTYIDSSLLFDYSLIVSELILNNQIKIPGKEKKALNRLLFSSVEDFGFASYQLGIWEPDFEDEDQIIRNIKIRIAAEDAKAGNTIKGSIGYLKNLLN